MPAGREIRLDGSPGPWRDTILIRLGERRGIALRAGNSCDRLLHRHILPPDAADLGTWIQVGG